MLNDSGLVHRERVTSILIQVLTAAQGEGMSHGLSCETQSQPWGRSDMQSDLTCLTWLQRESLATLNDSGFVHGARLVWILIEVGPVEGAEGAAHEPGCSCETTLGGGEDRGSLT